MPSSYEKPFLLYASLIARRIDDLGYGMRTYSIAVLLTLLVIGFVVPYATVAETTETTTRTMCPTYLTNLVVDYVDSTPHTATVGTTIVTTVHVIYPDGTPVTLSPETLSFRWSSDAGEKIFENVPVVPTGDPGYYTYTETVTEDFPTGTVTAYVLYCCASDGLGNYGPTDDVSSDETLTVEDNSKVDIGPSTPKPPTLQELLSTYAVPIAIAVILIIALLLLLARALRKKK